MMKRVLIVVVVLAVIGGVVLFVLDRTLFAPVEVSDEVPVAATIALPSSGPDATSAPDTQMTTEAPAVDTSGLQLYRIDEQQSQVRYEVSETLFNRGNIIQVAVGRTSGVAGEVLIDFENPANSQLGEIVIDVSQFQSDEARRDNFIRRNWLESARYPFVTFTPQSIEGFPQDVAIGDHLSLTVVGDMTVKETTQPVTWALELEVREDSLIGSASTQILMSDFGVGPIVILMLETEDEVGLFFDFVAVPVDASSATPAEMLADNETTDAAAVDDTSADALNVALLEPTIQEYDVPAGARPHDVAPAPDGGVWYTAQRQGALGYLDPETGETHHIALGAGSAPHGVIVGPDGAPWITDGGLNAIVRVDPVTEEIQVYPLPAGRANANLNTPTFDGDGVLWFTGQNGIYGRLDLARGAVEVFDAERGRGPYGIATAPDGVVYYASLAGSYIAQVDSQSGAALLLDPPTSGQGARRVWSDSMGHIWVSEWNAGQLAMYNPDTQAWQEWRLPGDNPQPYAVYVDEHDLVWLSDFGANAIVRFDPAEEVFEVFTLPSSPANVRQILGRAGEVWGAESGVDKLVVLRFPDA